MSSLPAAVCRLLQLPPDGTHETSEDLQNAVWIPDDVAGYRLCKLLDEGVYDVLVGFRDEQGFFEKRRVDRKLCELPSLNTNCDDLCTLTQPNAATVLQALTKRYTNSIIHTNCGLFCVVLNPWKWLPLYTEQLMLEYGSCGDLPPHVYTVAQNAFHGIQRGGQNQSILITGESGAGKTENTKKIIDFILHSCAGDQKTSDCVVTSGQILEAFGNAKTTHNSNSSRFGKFIRIEFDEDARLIGAKIECYLLEKSRVVSQNDGERNFHIFYQILSDYFDVPHKKFLRLGKNADGYKFLRNVVDDQLDDHEGAKLTNASFEKIGISSEEQRHILQMLSAILLIGEIKFGERSGLDMSFVENDADSEAVASLLELKGSRLVDALTQPTIKVHDKLIRKNQSLAKTVFSACAMAKVLYERLFGWVVDKCNKAFATGTPSTSSGINDENKFIAVLDIAGFEIIQKNSFEQFCINYTNERLQQFFNHFMFVKEQNDYLEEGIKWNQVDFANDLQLTIDLIEKPMGLLALLEEECVVPNGGDKSLLEKFSTNMASHPHFARSKQSQRCTVVRHFTVKHYAGDVHYNIDGWVEKNRDHVETSVLELLSQSTHPIVKALFPPVSTSVTKNRRGTMTQATVTFVYKNQLQSLLDTLNTSSAHFIRCVVPNYDRVPGRIDAPLVLNQLRCNGVLEAIRICREGFPSRLPHADFLARYRVLVAQTSSAAATSSSARDAAQTLCEKIGVDARRFCVGKTKVFCKVGVISELEGLRREFITSFITKIQAHIRHGFACRDLSERRKKQWAMLTVQNNVRVFSELSQWPWLRIFQLTRALIPRDRERLRIEELEKRNSQLQTELEALEERNEETLKEIFSLTLTLEKEKTKSEDATRTVDEIRQKLKEKEAEAKKANNEMEQNEGIFNMLEKKYQEQHQKVMKMNDVLRDYERKTEHFEMEKADLDKQIHKLSELYQRELATSERCRKEALDRTSVTDELQAQITRLLDENSQLKLQIARLETDSEDEKARAERQNNTISDLQKLITELNEKIARFDGVALNEKNATRKLERDKERLAEELKTAKEIIERQAKKMDHLKTEYARRESEVKRLERKLEDKDAMMQDCMKDIKETHKERVKELEQKMEDFKRRNSKLENENEMQKSTIDCFQRESSVDSDYGKSSSGRMSLSNVGRQYSLTSMGSFSSIRTLGLARKDSLSDLTSSVYSLRRRDSTFDMTQSMSSGLQRSPSTSNVMEKERRIQELEKERGAINTDLQLVKRELEVYKSQLNAVEMEKDSLQTTVRKQTGQIAETTRQFNSAQKNADNLALRLKKALADAETWKKKHEESVLDSKNEILAERKRAMERAETAEKENALKQCRLSNVEQSKSELNVELNKLQAELDRAKSIIVQLEDNLRSQETLGGSFELHQRNLQFEIESLRDENCALKAKIRRQYKQIELLTQQDDTSDELAHFEHKALRMDER